MMHEATLYKAYSTLFSLPTDWRACFRSALREEVISSWNYYAYFIPSNSSNLKSMHRVWNGMIWKGARCFLQQIPNSCGLSRAIRQVV